MSTYAHLVPGPLSLTAPTAALTIGPLLLSWIALETIWRDGMSLIKPSKFLHVGIPVNDLDRAKDFYVNVLGLEDSDAGRERTSPHSPVRLHCGDSPDPGQQVVLFHRPTPIEARSPDAEGHAHHAFIVTPEEFDLAFERFQEMGIFHRGPIVWRPDSHRTLYFFDPDGNYLQLADGDED